MDLKSLQFNWVDLVVVALLVAGLATGRRRGMSQELWELLKWLTVVTVAGLFYEPLGAYLAEGSALSLLACYWAAYGLLALTVLLVFSVFRRAVNEKLVSSDLFGRGEYYLGMVAGGLRHACAVLVLLALVHGRLYTPEELRQAVQFQQEEFGAVVLPTFGELRQHIVEYSCVGRFATRYLSAVLIRPTSPSERLTNPQENVVQARQRYLNEVLEAR
jgi:uncharacterized membrane protein required for colicin V production